jgi:flagellin-like hook-associated protein FlgL
MEVNLSSAVRTTLDATQRVSELQARTQEHLATGLRNNLIDDPQAVSIANSLSNRASDLLITKDALGQGASTVGATLYGLEFIDSLLDQAKAIAVQYEGTSDPAQQAALTQQFNVIAQQIDFAAQDTSYGGTNLIGAAPDTLNIVANEDGSSSINVTGTASDSASLGLTLSVAGVDAAQTSVRANAESIATSASVISIREDFNDKLVNSLEEGAAKLTRADLNEEAANALSLQTREQLSTFATGIAAQSDRSILQLF